MDVYDRVALNDCVAVLPTDSGKREFFGVVVGHDGNGSYRVQVLASTPIQETDTSPAMLSLTPTIILVLVDAKMRKILCLFVELFSEYKVRHLKGATDIFAVEFNDSRLSFDIRLEAFQF
jgi:hypothetical protein